ncbi:MAG: hypothetical protein V4510_12365 [bacterium]
MSPLDAPAITAFCKQSEPPRRPFYLTRWGWGISCYFEPRDLWVGCYYDRRRAGLTLYFCLVPTIVIKVML